MIKLELRAIFASHKIDLDRLAGLGLDVGGLIDAIAKKFANKEEEIQRLQALLKARAKRKSQQPIQKRRGPPRKHRRDLEYYWYWLGMQFNGGAFGKKGWLNAIVTDMDGTPLTPKKRRHIRKMLSEDTPAYFKRLRGVESDVMANAQQGIDEAEAQRWHVAGPTDGDLRS